MQTIHFRNRSYDNQNLLSAGIVIYALGCIMEMIFKAEQLQVLWIGITLLGALVLVYGWRHVILLRNFVIIEPRHIVIRINSISAERISIVKMDQVIQKGEFIHVIFDGNRKRYTFNTRNIIPDSIGQLMEKLRSLSKTDVTNG